MDSPVIDASHWRFLQAMEAHLQAQPHAGQPSRCADFAMFGQLTQLVGFDPTPRAIAHQLSHAQLRDVTMEDLGGLSCR